MYLVPLYTVFRAHQMRILAAARGISARESREDTRESHPRANIGFSCSARAPPSFSHSERRLKHLKSSSSRSLFLSLSPPLSLFLFCQAIMRDRNFPRARSGGNTGKYRAITIGVQSIYISLSFFRFFRREIHGEFLPWVL